MQLHRRLRDLMHFSELHSYWREIQEHYGDRTKDERLAMFAAGAGHDLAITEDIVEAYLKKYHKTTIDRIWTVYRQKYLD